MNVNVDSQVFRDTLIPHSEQYPEITADYAKIMENELNNSINAAAEKIMLIALSYSPQTDIDDANILFKYYNDLKTLFANLGSATKQLTPEETLKVLFTFYHPFTDIPFVLPKNILSHGGSLKDYVAPSYFVVKPKSIEVGEAYTRILYIKNYDRTLDDKFIIDLLDNNEKITVAKHITRLDKGEAAELVRKKMFELEEDLQRRKEQNHKKGGDFIPFRLKEKKAELEDLQDRLSSTTCELFEVSVFISISARSEDELESLTKYVQSQAKSHQVQIDVKGWQQDKALDTVLPFANPKFSTADDNSVSLFLLSDAAGVLIPFSAATHFQPNGIHYGTNSSTNSLIVLDRRLEMNSNGFIMGTSGSGKSVMSKAEIYEVMLKYPNDEVIVIDPDQEYGILAKRFNGSTLVLAPDSPTKLNVFDVNLDNTENGISAISLKAETIMTIVETAKGTELTSNEISIVDRCVRSVYDRFIKSGGDKQYLPTLTDFYNLLLEAKEPEARSLAVTLEVYVKGSFNIFAGKTSIDTNNRFMLFDISRMGNQIRTVGLQVVLEYVWQRVVENKRRGVRTWVWIDEFSIMFNDGAGRTTHKSGDFFANVYKRIRKYGGVPTAMTQNITEVLESPQARSMLGNSEFVLLLQQKRKDLEALSELFDLSPSQRYCLETGEVGTGLIVCGKKIIPFKKIIPKDSLMYRICSTKFGENKGA